jgi:hypothetical protein
MSSISQEKLDLIRQLARKQAAARSVSVSDGPHTMLSLYERNNLLQALSEHHRLYDPARGRLFPLFNEDFEGEEEGLPQHDLEEDEALSDVKRPPTASWILRSTSTSWTTPSAHSSGTQKSRPESDRSDPRSQTRATC